MPAPAPARADEFEALLAPLLGPALRLALSLTHQREDAEDLVQNAAVRAFSAFNRFEPGTNFKAWFFRVMVNVSLQNRRDAGRRPQTSTWEEVPASELEARHATGPRQDPAAHLLARVEGAQVMAALASLPPEFRAVAALYFVEELSYADIAAIVECPVGTVRSRLHRGRRLLQNALWPLAHEQGLVA